MYLASRQPWTPPFSRRLTALLDRKAGPRARPDGVRATRAARDPACRRFRTCSCSRNRRDAERTAAEPGVWLLDGLPATIQRLRPACLRDPHCSRDVMTTSLPDSAR